MKWKTFWQIVLLLIIVGVVVYMCIPKYKYHFYSFIPLRANKYTGAVEKYDAEQEKWIKHTYK